MSYSPYRFSGDFASIQRIAGKLKAEAEGTENEIDRAYLMGGANALYMLAPLIEEPTANNAVAMMYRKEGFADD